MALPVTDDAPFVPFDRVNSRVDSALLSPAQLVLNTRTGHDTRDGFIAALFKL